ISSIQFTSERLLEREDEIFAFQIERLTEEADSIKASIDNLMTPKIAQFDQMVTEFYANTAKHRNAMKSEISKFEKDMKVNVAALTDSQSKINQIAKRGNKLEKSIDSATEALHERTVGITNQIDELEKNILEYKKEMKKSATDFSKEFRLNKAQIYKSNVMLIDSQILFDAALTKFEVIENSLKYLISQSDNAEKNDQISIEQFEIYSESTDLAFSDLCKKVDKLELRLKRYESLSIENNEKLIQRDTHTNLKLEKHYETHRKWLYLWLSRSFGLLSTIIFQQQPQLFGLSIIQSLRSLDETRDVLEDDCSFIPAFVEDCKKECAALLKDLSIILFESYLMTAETADKVDALEKGKARIRSRITNLFTDFDITLKCSGLDEADLKNLSEIFSLLEARLIKDIESTFHTTNNSFDESIEKFHSLYEALVDEDPAFKTGVVTIDTSSDSSDDGNDQYDTSTRSSSSNSSSMWGVTSDLLIGTSKDGGYKPLRLVEKR
ncbi:hypothetical protein CANARDRAFT_185945, partial [[Candida] arabinofermentans NRRL YB-2248]